MIIRFLLTCNSLQVDINSFKSETIKRDTTEPEQQYTDSQWWIKNNENYAAASAVATEWQNGNVQNGGEINSTVFMSVYLSQLVLLIYFNILLLIFIFFFIHLFQPFEALSSI